MDEKLEKCLEYLRSRTDFKPDTAVVLGSGLGALADEIEAVCTVSYSEIPGFPVSTVAGHRGCFVFGSLNGKKVVAMQGRVHYYEGYKMSDVVLPVRLTGLLGAKSLLLSNAAGGLDLSYEVGDLMLITDQISSFVPSPLIGANDDALGTRFPDMSEIYSRRASQTMRDAASAVGLKLREGVYIQVTGPNYESPAEIGMFRNLGGSAVGMSTACEAIAARHMGLEVAGVSLITDVPGKDKAPLTHKEVTAVADRSAKKFCGLVSEFIKRL